MATAEQTPMCWFGDGPATAEYWFEPKKEWRRVCVSHEANAVANLPEHYVRRRLMATHKPSRALDGKAYT